MFIHTSHRASVPHIPNELIRHAIQLNSICRHPMPNRIGKHNESCRLCLAIGGHALAKCIIHPSNLKQFSYNIISIIIVFQGRYRAARSLCFEINIIKVIYRQSQKSVSHEMRVCVVLCRKTSLPSCNIFA